LIIILFLLFFSEQRKKLRFIAAEIKASKNRINGIINRRKVTEDADVAHVQYLVHTLRIFETEFLVQLKEYDQVSAVIEVYFVALAPHGAAVAPLTLCTAGSC
jgi:hypothetical protein